MIPICNTVCGADAATVSAAGAFAAIAMLGVTADLTVDTDGGPIQISFTEDDEIEGFAFTPLGGLLTYEGSPQAFRILGRASVEPGGGAVGAALVTLGIGLGDPLVPQTGSGIVEVSADEDEIVHVTVELVRTLVPGDVIGLFLATNQPGGYPLTLHSAQLSVSRA